MVCSTRCCGVSRDQPGGSGAATGRARDASAAAPFAADIDEADADDDDAVVDGEIAPVQSRMSSSLP